MTDIHCKAPILPRCCRCGRTLRNPVLIGGDNYGSTCAKAFGGARAVTPAAASLTPRDPLDFDLFDGIDLDGAEIQARARVAQVVDAAAKRELASMRASWTAA